MSVNGLVIRRDRLRLRIKQPRECPSGYSDYWVSSEAERGRYGHGRRYPSNRLAPVRLTVPVSNAGGHPIRTSLPNGEPRLSSRAKQWRLAILKAQSASSKRPSCTFAISLLGMEIGRYRSNVPAIWSKTPSACTIKTSFSKYADSADRRGTLSKENQGRLALLQGGPFFAHRCSIGPQRPLN